MGLVCSRSILQQSLLGQEFQKAIRPGIGRQLLFP